jgi:hypothetical protein
MTSDEQTIKRLQGIIDRRIELAVGISGPLIVKNRAIIDDLKEVVAELEERVAEAAQQEQWDRTHAEMNQALRDPSSPWY